MKFILNKDILIIDNIELINSGSLTYYEAEVEYDEAWEGLTIEAVMVRGDEKGTSTAVINNKVYIDQSLEGWYSIGFVGYKLEENKKVFQISTSLEPIAFNKGAGEIEVEYKQVPTPTEWEIYIAQIQEMLEKISVSEGKVDDVLVNGQSVVVDKIANIDLSSLSELDNVLRDILEAIQNGTSSSMIIEEIEQIIVSYFENKTVEEVEA
jgi:hypothetical protein